MEDNRFVLFSWKRLITPSLAPHQKRKLKIGSTEKREEYKKKEDPDRVFFLNRPTHTEPKSNKK